MPPNVSADLRGGRDGTPLLPSRLRRSRKAALRALLRAFMGLPET
jgi:hypothetical protein